MLTRTDIETYLTVRERALEYIEESLDRVESGTGAAVENVEAFRAAEKAAVRKLGLDWARYSDVREEIARLLTAQRQHEDAQLLATELRRARGELKNQLELTRDTASREFLQAQLESLDGQLARLQREMKPSPVEAEQQQLLEAYRADIAIQQGRQERLERRIRELIRDRRSQPTASPDGRDAGSVGEEER